MIVTLLVLFLYLLPGIVCTKVFYHEIKNEHKDKDIYVKDLPFILVLILVSWMPVISLILALNMIEEFCEYMKLTEPVKEFANIKLYFVKKTEKGE